jgi:hypothetical protein
MDNGKDGERIMHNFELFDTYGGGQAGRKRDSVIRDQLGRWRRGKGLGTQVRIVEFNGGRR